MKPVLQLAVLQCEPQAGDVAANLAAVTFAAHAARADGADILVCPELMATGYNIGAARIAALAETFDGPIQAQVAAIAADARIAIVYGYPERDGNEIYNAAQFIDGTGRRLLNYRKTHLFGAAERATLCAGDSTQAVCELHGWCIGLLICYDVEFPEAARLLALAGADLVLVPTALMQPYAQIPGVLIPARAYENQVYIAYANYCGSEGELEYCGNSIIAAPSGSVLARGERAPALLGANISANELGASRRLNTYFEDRRPVLYAAIAATEDSR